MSGFDPELLKGFIRDVPDFPTPGVTFKDITPLLADPDAFAMVVDAIVSHRRGSVDKVCGIEARGFILAAPVAYELGAGFIPIRKRGKLPGATIAESYDLEYGSETIEMHDDALSPGERVLIVDDVLATGGTAAAAASLVEGVGGEVVGITCVIELASLGGRQRLTGRDLNCLIDY